MKKTKSLFAQLHDANERIKELEKKCKCCMTCFHFHDINGYRCNLHGEKALIKSPSNQLCEQYTQVGGV
jgi:hypothetical protein